MGDCIKFGIRQNYRTTYQQTDNRPDPVEVSRISNLVENAQDAFARKLGTEGFRFRMPSAAEPHAYDSVKLGYTADQVIKGLAMFAALIARVSRIASGTEFFLDYEGHGMAPIYIKNGLARLDVDSVRGTIDRCEELDAKYPADADPFTRAIGDSARKALKRMRADLKKYGNKSEWLPIETFLYKEVAAEYPHMVLAVEALDARGSVRRLM